MPAFEDLLRAADAALYAGKRAGGDRVSLMAAGHGESVPESVPAA